MSLNTVLLIIFYSVGLLAALYFAYYDYRLVCLHYEKDEENSAHFYKWLKLFGFWCGYAVISALGIIFYLCKELT